MKAAIFVALEEDQPMTVRQVFYRLVSLGAIPKNAAEYKQTVVRLLSDMRRKREIPFHWIADNTRWMRKSTSYTSISQALQRTAECYRRAIWDWQSVYMEVWLEKDALAGVLMDETDPWDVPLMVTRGYPSLSFLYSAAETIAAQGKPAHLYYFGDYDPSGVDIPRNVEASIRELAPETELHFHRVAVTQEQIRSMGLLTRPTKKTDSRSHNFEGESVEVDAIPPRELRALAATCITQHINPHTWEKLQETERQERESLQRVAQIMRQAA